VGGFRNSAVLRALHLPLKEACPFIVPPEESRLKGKVPIAVERVKRIR